MAEVISPRVILKSENYDGESGGFHAVYIQEPEDDSNSCRRHEEEEDNSLPRNKNVESFDPTQFLQVLKSHQTKLQLDPSQQHQLP